MQQTPYWAHLAHFGENRIFPAASKQHWFQKSIFFKTPGVQNHNVYMIELFKFKTVGL